MCGESDDEIINEGEEVVGQDEVKKEDRNEEERGEIDEKEKEQKEGKRKIRVAVAGCVHGEIDKVYRTMEELEKDGKGKFDLLLCCGDFQATRNYGDLHHMHVPEKYRSLETFYKYYSKAKKAPVLTIFIGGNHEASGYMCELPNGGWVAPNIYYMGNSNVLKYGGLRIGGLSGIYKGGDYHKGRFECPPFPMGSIVSAYHVRSLDVFRCKQLSSLDIFLSHDWPTGIWDYGDKEWLLRKKRHFTDDINSGTMGNPGARELMMKLRPNYWFSAHMHVGFPALVEHQSKEGEEEGRMTRFLSLDKPLPGRHFLQSLHLWVDEDADLSLSYDEEWLAILKSTDSLVNTRNEKVFLPSHTNKSERYDFHPTEEEITSIRSLKEDLHIPFNFQPTAPPLEKDDEDAKKAPPSYYYRNPQSTEFCSWLGVCDVNEILAASTTVATPHYQIEKSKDGLKDVEQDREEFGEEDFVIDTGSFGEEKEEEVVRYFSDGNGLGDWKPPSINISDETNEERKEEENASFVIKRRKVDIDPEE